MSTKEFNKGLKLLARLIARAYLDTLPEEHEFVGGNATINTKLTNGEDGNLGGQSGDVADTE